MDPGSRASLEDFHPAWETTGYEFQVVRSCPSPRRSTDANAAYPPRTCGVNPSRTCSRPCSVNA